jgi:hypothetical protein
VVGPEKSNLSRTVPASRFRIDSVRKFAPTADDDGTVPKLTYIGDSEHTARDMFATAAEQSNGDEKAVDRWLKDYLTTYGGGQWAVTVYETGKGQGYTAEQLKRARYRCGIASERPENPGPWFWMLPGEQLEGRTLPPRDRKPSDA